MSYISCLFGNFIVLVFHYLTVFIAICSGVHEHALSCATLWDTFATDIFLYTVKHSREVHKVMNICDVFLAMEW